MTSRILCTLDPGAVGPGLSVDEGGQVVTTLQNGLDLDRAVHGTLAVRAEGVYRFECYHWSNSRDDLAGLVSIGVSQPDASLDAAVGSEDISWALRPADGAIYTDDSSLATVDIVAERTSIVVELTIASGSCTCAWYVNGGQVHEATLPTGKAWVPAFSLGCAEAGDISIVANFGQWRFDLTRETASDAWAITTAGLATIYVSRATEGFLSATTDSPANQSFGPFLLDPDKWSVRRGALDWPHRGDDGVGLTTYSVLRLDNSQGTYNALRDTDVRDAVLSLQRLDAPAGGAGSLTDATKVCTAIIDEVRAPSSDVLEIRLKDNLARFDAPTPCRIIAPFHAEGARGRIQPIGLGAQRNVQPILLDEATNTYLLADAPLANVPLVADGGATLDPLAVPPQWSATGDGKGIALNVAPARRLSADCSSEGTQYTIPGAEDVLEGLGEFTTWDKGAPDGWTQIASANGSIAQISSFGLTSALAITSRINYDDDGTRYGYWVKLTDAVLEPGRTYRFTFKMPYVQGQNTTPGGNPCSYGLAILTALDHDPKYWVTPHESPVFQSLPADRNYSFVYRVPGAQGTDPLPIYICLFSDTGNIATLPTTLTAVAYIDDLRVQLLGQYVSVPMEGITLTDAFREVLVERCGESAAIFSSTDTQAIDDATGYRIGIRKEEQPNTAALLQEIADQWGAVVFCDKANQIRVRRITDPSEGAVVAAFDASNIDLSDRKRFVVTTDDAPGLTTSFGARRNWAPYAPGDFVTDTDLVPPSQREQWQGTSQYRFNAARRPSQQYAHAVGAPRFEYLHDDLETARTEGNRVVNQYAPADPRGAGVHALAPKRLARNLLRFDALFDPGGELGVGTSITPEDLLPGDIITVTLPDEGFNGRRMVVLSVEVYSFGGRATIMARY
jgi:hypothetical protein